QNKVGQFLSSSLIRNIVGQTVSSFNIREVMDQKKILIINLAKGRIGEDNGALLGAMMITKIQLAAMGRVDIPEEERKDFYLYVDEFQNFATESFANILSEARKYHLNLILANQYVTQIAEEVRDAIFGNAGSIVSFRVGAMDAEFLEKEFEPVFMMNDIVNLEKYHIYLKLMIDGIAGDAFSATTLPPIKLEDVGNESKIINSSRERYSSSKAEVEDKIRRWSGMLSPEERQAIVDEKQMSAPQVVVPQIATLPGQSAPPRRPSIERSSSIKKSETPARNASHNDAGGVARPSVPQPLKERSEKIISEKLESLPHKIVSRTVSDATWEKEASSKKEEEKTPEQAVVEKALVSEAEEKKLYPANCATCGADIEVPFVPDGKRPTFCKDCLRDYQRSVAKVRNEVDAKNAAVQQQQPKPVSSQLASPERVTHHKTYASTDTPMSLAQLQHVGPKKFKPLRNRPSVNLDEVRALIDANRKGD
ncbi:MAG: type IV secretory system conjugative DNA transfer family protein, partial [bacterium]|nr:type IV secretory system conjugative DNA transfer family protein [bacterium]